MLLLLASSEYGDSIQWRPRKLRHLLGPSGRVAYLDPGNPGIANFLKNDGKCTPSSSFNLGQPSRRTETTPTSNGKEISEEKVPTPPTKLPKITKTFSDKSAEIFQSMGDNCPFTFDKNDFDFDDCNVSGVTISSLV